MGYVLVRSDRRETTAVFEDMSDSFRTLENVPYVVGGQK